MPDNGTCKALEMLSHHAISLWEAHQAITLSLRPDDQGLVVSFTYPDGQMPVPDMLYSEPLSFEYVRAHTQACLLTRLSDDFVERNKSACSPIVLPERKVRVGI